MDLLLYRGKPFESYSREELLAIAKEGWQAYHNLLERNLSTNATWAALLHAKNSPF